MYRCRGAQWVACGVRWQDNRLGTSIAADGVGRLPVLVTVAVADEEVSGMAEILVGTASWTDWTSMYEVRLSHPRTEKCDPAAECALSNVPMWKEV